MAKAAELDNSDLKGSLIEIEKHMDENSRRIKKFTGIISLPKNLSPKTKSKIIAAMKTCPVTRSLRADLEIELKEI